MENGKLFQGFTPETVDFLWGIRMNNQRDWFLEHKKDYVNHLYQPMKDLGQDLARFMADRPGNLVKVSRIYRDARLHHPLPYKESLWICIRQDVEWWGENPCLYFEINPEGIDYGFFIWKPRPGMMKEFRRQIAADPRKFLTMVAQAEASTGLEIQAKAYKHPEKCDDPDLERFYLWKEQIGCSVHEDFSPDTFGPELGIRAAELFEKLLPLYDFFSRFSV